MGKTRQVNNLISHRVVCHSNVIEIDNMSCVSYVLGKAKND